MLFRSTDPPTVTKLIRLFNGLPTMPPGREGSAPANCPESHVTLTFATTTTASADVAAVIDPSCDLTWGVTARGRQQPALDDSGRPLAGPVLAALQGSV